MDTPKNAPRKGSPDKLHVEAPGHGSCLVQIRAIAVDLARKVGFDEHEIAKIEIAVDEACSNIVKHAYANDKEWSWRHRDPQIRLELRTEEGRLVIEINDHGQRFDFASYRPTDIDHRLREMNPGGYGIAIIRRFMDEVQYSSNDQTGNTLRLVKYLKKA
jgi:serine/threonine-protein kinase RsbW